MQICERKLYSIVPVVFACLAVKKQTLLIFKDILVIVLRKYLVSKQMKK